jgi:hypothetical protein
MNIFDIRFISHLIYSKADSIPHIIRLHFIYLRLGPIINRFSKSTLVKQIIYVMTLSNVHDGP